MARAFHYRDKFTWTHLYKTYVRCHLEYCVQAWSSYYAADKAGLSILALNVFSVNV